MAFLFHNRAGERKPDQLATERIRSLVLMVCLRGLDSSDGLADLLSQRVEDTFAVAEKPHRTPRFQRYSESR